MPVGKMDRQWGVREIEAKYTSRYKDDKGAAVSIGDDHGFWRRRPRSNCPSSSSDIEGLVPDRCLPLGWTYETTRGHDGQRTTGRTVA